MSVIKTNQAFRGYSMSYKVEIVERKVQTVQLASTLRCLINVFTPHPPAPTLSARLLIFQFFSDLLGPY